MTTDQKHVTALTIKSVLGIRAVHLDTAGNDCVIVSGANGAGKTSVLDSLAMALGGADLVPKQPIRQGETSGSVEVQIGDADTDRALIVTRAFTASGGTALTVRGADGSKQRTPQTLLNDLVGPFAFDPSAFPKMSAPERLRALLDLVGVDIAEAKAAVKVAYDVRADANREAARCQAAKEATPWHDDAPATEVDTKVVAEQLGDLKVARAQANAADAKLEALMTEVGENQAALWAATERLDASLRRRDEQVVAVEEAYAVDGLSEEHMAEIEKRLQSASAINAHVRTNAQHLAAVDTATLAHDKAAAIGTTLTEARNAFDAMLVDAAAKLDIPGLVIGDGNLSYNGIPFDQVNSADQLRVSTALALAGTAPLKLLLIRNGNDLDPKSLAIVREMAAEAGADIFLERWDTEGASVVIEDGMVLEEGPSGMVWGAGHNGPPDAQGQGGLFAFGDDDIPT